MPDILFDVKTHINVNLKMPFINAEISARFEYSLFSFEKLANDFGFWQPIIPELAASTLAKCAARCDPSEMSCA